MAFFCWNNWQSNCVKSSSNAVLRAVGVDGIVGALEERMGDGVGGVYNVCPVNGLIAGVDF